MKTEIKLMQDGSVELHLTSSSERHKETGEKLRYFVEDLTLPEFLEFSNEVKEARDTIDPSNLYLQEALMAEFEDSKQIIADLKKEIESLTPKKKKTKGGKK